MYDYDDLGWIESERELELNAKGFKFLTNFSIESEPFYRESAEIHNVNYIIDNEAYDCSGNLYDNGKYTKAFYVDSKIGDMSHFWKTVNELRGRGKRYNNPLPMDNSYDKLEL